MVKIKVTQEVVNRWGKRYIAENWVIDVSEQDLIYFDWFAKVESKKINTKKTKDESNK